MPAPVDVLQGQPSGGHGHVRAQVRRRGGVSGSAFRADIEGLRGVAVLLVVAYHAGIPTFQGGFVGVDVFFVISGFLITGLLLREIEQSGTIRLRVFYARRARRLLPLAATVLIVTAIAARLVMSPLDLEPFRGDATAAAFYFANWHFAASQLSYLNAESATSPLLHYWSLAVEEQFYLVWPILMLAATTGRGPCRRVPARARVGVLASVVIAGSFYVSATSTASQGALAYYGLHTRAFELAAGALLAVLAGRIARSPAAVAKASQYAGLAIIFYSAIAFSRSTVFPGTAAAIPVAGALLVLAGSSRTRLLTSSPMRFVGRVSYAWYLTHWPVLVLVAYATNHGDSTTSWPWTAAAVLASFLLAVAAHYAVEQPARFATGLTRAAWRSLTVGVCASALAALIGGATTAEGATSATTSAISPMQHHTKCNLVHNQTALATCTLGDPARPPTIAIFGDSHAAMWAAALDQYGRVHQQSTLELTKEGCDFADITTIHPNYPNAPYTQCDTWRAHAYAYLRAHPVDTVVVVRSANTINRIWADGHALSGDAAPAAYAAGFARALRDIGPTVRHVVVIEDTPMAPYNVLRCVAEHTSPRNACDFPAHAAVHRDTALLEAERKAADARVSFADITPTVCPGTRCPARMRNGDIIYWDSNHLTDTYSRSISEELLAAIHSATPASAFVIPAPSR